MVANHLLILMMATAVIMVSSFEGRHGTHTVKILDTLGENVPSRGTEVADIEWSYGEPRHKFDGARGGRIGSQCVLTLVGDKSHSLRGIVDEVVDDRRYPVHITGPLNE